MNGCQEHNLVPYQGLSWVGKHTGPPIGIESIVLWAHAMWSAQQIQAPDPWAGDGIGSITPVWSRFWVGGRGERKRGQRGKETAFVFWTIRNCFEDAAMNIPLHVDFLN